MPRNLKLALFVGGPSRERGISLNSGRSIVDHLAGADIAIEPIVYLDTRARAFEIDRNLLYCNTPDDFDFKLSGSPALDAGKLQALLAGVDLAFGAIHGELGEDGALQAQLDAWGIPYVGSGAAACERAYDKALAAAHLAACGLPGVPSLVCSSPADVAPSEVAAWIASHGAVVAKPARGGSSLGITVHRSAEALARHLLTQPLAHGYVVQPYLQGSEFTVVVLAGERGPVAMPPVEIELHRRDGDGIFSYRHKYLSTNDSAYHCPPRYPESVTGRIRALAAEVFERFELADFARIDGWYGTDGSVVISDINPISGMEQNSFLFLQTAEIGLSHATTLRHVVRRACLRAGLQPVLSVPGATGGTADGTNRADGTNGRLPVPVLFGGSTAERQVSLLSGSNVWLKLRQSARFDPTPYLLRADGSLWRLPYAAALRHTVEEVEAYCQRTRGDQTAVEQLRARVRADLGLDPAIALEPATAEPADLATVLAGTGVVFLALHGGAGEDGTLQRACEEAGVAFNGPGSAASALCMDKYATAEALAGLAPEGIYTSAHLLLDRPVGELAASEAALAAAWAEVAARLGPPPYVIKPIGDGCSAGVVPLRTAEDLAAYVGACARGETRLSGASFSLLDEGYIVEMPAFHPGGAEGAGPRLMIEQFVATDSVTIRTSAGDEDSALVIGERSRTGWIEVTVGVLGNRGSLRALSPSLTVASDRILSLEEKFMGGTGVNLTPPPVPPLGHVQPEAIEAARARIERVAAVLGLEGYARIDAFMRVDTGEISVIEVNTLPGLTPSTVIFHQALAEPTPMSPRTFLEELLALGLDRQARAGAGSSSRGPAAGAPVAGAPARAEG